MPEDKVREKDGLYYGRSVEAASYDYETMNIYVTANAIKDSPIILQYNKTHFKEIKNSAN